MSCCAERGGTHGIVHVLHSSPTSHPTRDRATPIESQISSSTLPSFVIMCCSHLMLDGSLRMIRYSDPSIVPPVNPSGEWLRH